jgi:thymidylate synthase
MHNIDEEYRQLLMDILINGVKKEDRTGTGTRSVFGRQIRHSMSEGFPLLTTKKMAWKSIVTELIWFLRGDTNIKYLVDNGCHIWTGDAYKRYVEAHKKEWSDKMTPEQLEKSYPDVKEFEDLIKTVPEFAKTWGELGPIYGKQWRKWNYQSKKNHYVMAGQPTHHNINIDQIINLISELKSNPDSRRLMVSAWNVGEVDKMVLPPCHYGFQVYTRKLTFQERLDFYDPQKLYHNEVAAWFLDELNIPTRAISLMWNQRSVDTFLGLPFNIASYALLLEIIAKEVNMIPDEIIGNLGDVHLYLDHIEQAKEQISRKPFELPKLKMNPIFLANLEHKSFDEAINGVVSFELENYQSHPAIKAPLSN